MECTQVDAPTHSAGDLRQRSPWMRDLHNKVAPEDVSDTCDSPEHRVEDLGRTSDIVLGQHAETQIDGRLRSTRGALDRGGLCHLRA